MSKGTRQLYLAAVLSVVALGLLGPFSSAAGAGQSKRRPVKVEEQLEFGVDMAKRGLWNEALFRFTRAADLSPGNPRILNNLAVAYEAVGEFEQAMEFYKRALKVDPGNSDLKRNYARFVEFYQGFRPRKPEESESAVDDAGAATDDDGEGDAESGLPIAWSGTAA